ncbi:unnamed protein product [Parnassius apollo]|uniref:(apollo) hypothetical protein n=1 Tax=Parnassius apollo TaxID=110799 RepID=A0A8S3YEG0_PARAO|nr:unnamed protein product [Parnassius apollo]
MDTLQDRLILGWQNEKDSDDSDGLEGPNYSSDEDSDYGPYMLEKKVIMKQIQSKNMIMKILSTNFRR